MPRQRLNLREGANAKVNPNSKVQAKVYANG